MRDRPAGGTEAELGISARKCTGSRQERFCGREDASAHDCACRKRCDRDLHRKMHGLDARCPYGKRRGPAAEPPTATVVSPLVTLVSPCPSPRCFKEADRSLQSCHSYNSKLSLNFRTSTLPHAGTDINWSKKRYNTTTICYKPGETKKNQKFEMILLSFSDLKLFFLSCAPKAIF
jgi:hypothetical protein